MTTPVYPFTAFSFAVEIYVGGLPFELINKTLDKKALSHLIVNQRSEYDRAQRTLAGRGVDAGHHLIGLRHAGHKRE